MSASAHRRARQCPAASLQPSRSRDSIYIIRFCLGFAIDEPILQSLMIGRWPEECATTRRNFAFFLFYSILYGESYLHSLLPCITAPRGGVRYGTHHAASPLPGKPCRRNRLPSLANNLFRTHCV